MQLANNSLRDFGAYSKAIQLFPSKLSHMQAKVVAVELVLSTIIRATDCPTKDAIIKFRVLRTN